MRRLGAALVGCVLVAAACSSEPQGEIDGATTSTTQATPTTVAAASTTEPTTEPPRQRGGDVVIVNANPGRDFAQSLNPYTPGGNWTPASWFSTALWWSDVRGELVPIVVQAVPTVENGLVTVGADGTMTVRYEIRDDAVWSDGVPISGDDLQFTLDTVLEYGSELQLVVDNDLLGPYQEIVSTKVGDGWFEATFATPTLLFESLFQPLIPKHQVEGTDFLEDWNDEPWVQGSDLLLDEWAGPGEAGWRLVRNPKFWLEDPDTGVALPYLDSITVEFYECDDADAVAGFLDSLESGAVHDVALCNTEAAHAYEPPDGVTTRFESGAEWSHLAFQFGDGRKGRNPEAVTDDLRVRQAIAHAIDKSQLVTDAYEGAVSTPGDLALDSYVSAFSPSLSAKPWTRYDYDLDRARELLADFCADEVSRCPEGGPTVVFTTTENFPYRPRLAASLERMLSEAGFHVVLDLEDSGTFFGESVPNGVFDLAEWAWPASPSLAFLISIQGLWDPESPPPDGSNYYRWGTDDPTDASSRYAEIFDEMAGVLERDRLGSLFTEAEQILADDLVFIPLFVRPRFFAQADCLVTGELAGGVPSELFMNWYVTDECR